MAMASDDVDDEEELIDVYLDNDNRNKLTFEQFCRLLGYHGAIVDLPELPPVADGDISEDEEETIDASAVATSGEADFEKGLEPIVHAMVYNPEPREAGEGVSLKVFPVFPDLAVGRRERWECAKGVSWCGVGIYDQFGRRVLDCDFGAKRETELNLALTLFM